MDTEENDPGRGTEQTTRTDAGHAPGGDTAQQPGAPRASFNEGLAARSVQRMQEFFTNIVRRYVPDPFVLAIGFTLAVMVLAVVVEHQNPVETVQSWGDGFWELLEFTTQMAFVLIAGYVLAHAPLVDRLLNAIASKVHTPRGAIVVATLVGGLGSYLNWGFGLVVGGVIAKKLATEVRGVHYPLIIAAAYSGFTLYGLGLSASIPLVISTAGHPLQDAMGLVPLTQTIWSAPMIATAAATLLVLLLVNPMMQPSRPDQVTEITPEANDAAPVSGVGTSEEGTLANRLNESRVLGYVIGVIGLGYLVMHLIDVQLLDIDTVNFALLFIGIMLMGTPAAYVAAVGNAVRTAAGIILQYPFYAGIMAVMASSGLAALVGSWFTGFASAESLPFFGLVSSYVINFFAPSAGGHWVVQGPFMIEAAHNMSSSLAQNAMAVQLGNAWQDVIQPLWILPALALSKLHLKDIMGYLVISMIAVGAVYIVAMLLWGYLGG